MWRICNLLLLRATRRNCCFQDRRSQTLARSVILLTCLVISPSSSRILGPIRAGFRQAKVAAAALCVSTSISFQARAPWKCSQLPSVLSQPVLQLLLCLRLRSSLQSAFPLRIPAIPLPATAPSATAKVLLSRGILEPSTDSSRHKLILW